MWKRQHDQQQNDQRKHEPTAAALVAKRTSEEEHTAKGRKDEATLFRNYPARALFQALGTHSAPSLYQSARGLPNAYVQYQHPRGEEGKIEGEKREYRNVAYPIYAKQQQTLVTLSR